MGVETALAAGAVGAPLFGAIGADRANKRAVGAANADRSKIWELAQSLMSGGGVNPFQGDISALISKLSGADPATYKPGVATTSTGNPTFNSGNDALMQMVRADPNTQLDPIAQAFFRTQVKTGGNPFDTSSLFSSLGAVDNANIDSQVAALRGRASGLGQRFGTGSGINETLLRTGALRDIGARNAGIQQQSYEAGQGRATAAAGTLNNSLLQLLGMRQGAAGSLLGAGQDLMHSENQNNQFNVSTGLQAEGLNQSAHQAQIQALIQSIMGGAGIAQNSNDFMARIFGSLAGGPGTQTLPSSQLPGAVGDAATMGLILKLLNSGGKK